MPSAKSSVQKAKKPYPDFPLTSHPTGYWCKKIKGKLHYFGTKGCEPEEALQEYLEVRDDLHAGREATRAGGATVRDAVNYFLTDRKHRLNTGDIQEVTFKDYVDLCAIVVEQLGSSTTVTSLGPDNFASLREYMASRWGPVRLGNEVQYVRSIFKHLFEIGKIEAPVRFGPSFRKPPKKVLRANKNSRPAKSFSAKEIRSMIDEASAPMKAMIYLAINCGYGNSDVARLKELDLDLQAGWATHPRPKTGIIRRCPLWHETIDALRDALLEKPTGSNAEIDSLVFVTRTGNAWDTKRYSAVAQEFGKLTRKVGCYRKGVGFYAIRHVFETVGGDSRDQVAVDFLMGHAKEDMGSVYRTAIEGERESEISDERLVAVTDHVRRWLHKDQKNSS